MDWITVAVEFIKEWEVPSYIIQYPNKASISLYSYISCVDIIWQSINTLHKLIIDSTSEPFSERDDVWNNLHNLTDNNYFKRIRAVFGAHPIDVYPESSAVKKRYASWINDYRQFPEYDFSVFLYPDNQNATISVFGFKLDQLNKFLDQRYSYLENIESEMAGSLSVWKNPPLHD
ncbi:hypothetical protein LJC55_02815 [Eubacteriales bacterium OttesenSCG-928-N14]|nr:hypothetical protein [Eubacteriales bacterium OttesenSCG-928-N14]